MSSGPCIFFFFPAPLFFSAFTSHGPRGFCFSFPRRACSINDALPREQDSLTPFLTSPSRACVRGKRTSSVEREAKFALGTQLDESPSEPEAFFARFLLSFFSVSMALWRVEVMLMKCNSFIHHCIDSLHPQWTIPTEWRAPRPRIALRTQPPWRETCASHSYPRAETYRCGSVLPVKGGEDVRPSVSSSSF